MVHMMAGRRLKKLASILALGCLGMAHSQGAVQAQSIISTTGAPIDLIPGRGVLLKLDTPAASVFLANPDVADVELKSPTLLYLYAKSVGTTSLYVLDDAEEVAISRSIAVALDLEALNSAARAAVGGSFSVIENGGALVLRGSVDTLPEAERAMDVVQSLAGPQAKVVSSLNLATPAQVNLQVRIAEVSRTVTQDLGVTWDIVSGGGRWGGSLTGGTGVPGGFRLSGNRVTGSSDLGVSLEALQTRGLITILSEPNLTARSGDQASFLAGGRYPYVSESTNGDRAFRFEPYGVELNFTPEVRKSNQIKLSVDTRIRELDFSTATAQQNGSPMPNILERSASTTIELASGQSFAIAGLFKSNSLQNMREIPGVSQIPILGALFRSTAFQKGETELVVIVTPYLVEPTNPRNLRTPVDNFAPAGIGQRQLLGDFVVGTNISNGDASPMSSINGHAGFLLQ